jgi:alpha-beta hydrolase superfamily lysophospholipase
VIWIARALLALLALLVAAAALAFVVGPRAPVAGDVAVDPAALPEDLDAWLAAKEAAVPDLRAGAEKRIVWAGAAGARTPLSVVYVHGFSASAEELRPVPDRVAEALGANLFFTRLAGHGRDGAAMAEARAGDWVADMAEAMAIGRRIGERVIVIGTSTGGTLAALAALDPALPEALGEGLAGIVFVSPNFRIANPAAPLLTLPGARHWLPALVGEERGFTPINTGHAAHWTTRYPSVAVLPVAALAAHVRGLDAGATEVPALFLYSEHDKVISPRAVRRAYAAWGGPKRLVPFVMAPGDDPYSHVLAGEILSPAQTERAVAEILGWARALPGP